MDTWINPITRDYQLQGGAPLRDPAGGLANACYLRLEIPLGSYWADPKLGSQLHLLRREKDVSRVALLAKQYAEQALAPIVVDGRAKSITVTTEQLHTGRLNLLIDVLAASGERFTFKHPVGVI